MPASEPVVCNGAHTRRQGCEHGRAILRQRRQEPLRNQSRSDGVGMERFDHRVSLYGAIGPLRAQSGRLKHAGRYNDKLRRPRPSCGGFYGRLIGQVDAGRDNAVIAEFDPPAAESEDAIILTGSRKTFRQRPANPA